MILVRCSSAASPFVIPGENEEDLEPWAETEAVILIGDNGGIHYKGWNGTDVDHHVDEEMLLDVKGSWVEADFAAPRIQGSTQVRMGRMRASALLNGYATRRTMEGTKKGAG